MKARILLGALGVATAAYGAWLLLQEDLADLVNAVVWLAAGVVLHDFVLVPLTLAVGWLVIRHVPHGRRSAVLAGLVVLGTLTVTAVPVLGRFGERADNPTILDRDYAAGWLVVTAIIALAVCARLLMQSRPRR
jgi:hypothetical protein